MARRFFIENKNIDDNIEIIGEEYNHIVNVLRYKTGDNVIICNNTGTDYYATITEINKKSVSLKINKTMLNPNEPKTQVDVFQALVKGEKFELIAQKLTELGVSALYPFTNEYVTVKEGTARLNRLDKISIEASKQCGRAKTLDIKNVLSFKQLIERLKVYDIVVFAYEHANEVFKLESLKKYINKKVAIVVGSEGGFSEKEIEKISELPNTKIITMGKRILRAETAVIGLTSVIMFGLNEWIN